MNIRQLISNKKRAIREKQDVRVRAQLSEIEDMRKEREREEYRNAIREKYRQERAALKRAKYQRFKQTFQNLRVGMVEMNKKIEERERNGEGIFAR